MSNLKLIHHITNKIYLLEKLVLYCKSYINDLEHVKILLDSVKEFNIESIPFYISVPKAHFDTFKKELIGDYTLLIDEDIVSADQGWMGQQIVKSEFWKLGLCENYLCIDSDCLFIKPFYKKDFMFDENTPYTICHEYKSLFEFMDKNPLSFDPYVSFVEDREKIMKVFDRDGVIYDFGPGPTIWSTKVWSSLEEHYLKPNNLKFKDLIDHCPSEFTWYGEWLLASKCIDLFPRGPLFKNYHYPHQYDLDQQQNYDIDKIKKLYLGIGLQSIYNLKLKK